MVLMALFNVTGAVAYAARVGDPFRLLEMDNVNCWAGS